MSDTSSSKLTLYHDGQFWVALCEHADERGYGACRHVFGAEPSDQEVLRFVCEQWHLLAFSAPVDVMPKSPASNPKRRQREAAQELAASPASTKAQQALGRQREEAKQESTQRGREKRTAEKDRQFELRQAKRRSRRRGK